MGDLKARQGGEFPLEGLVEVVRGRERTRRLNRRERRHLASESSVLARSYAWEDGREGRCLAPQHPRWREPTNHSAPTIAGAKPDHKLVTLRASLSNKDSDAWLTGEAALMVSSNCGSLCKALLSGRTCA